MRSGLLLFLLIKMAVAREDNVRWKVKGMGLFAEERYLDTQHKMR
jgi:hypothetical protein